MITDHCMGCALTGLPEDCADYQPPASLGRHERQRELLAYWYADRTRPLQDAATALPGASNDVLEWGAQFLFTLEQGACECGNCPEEGDLECDDCHGTRRALGRDGKPYQAALVRLYGRQAGRVVCPGCGRDADPQAHTECACGQLWREDGGAR